MRILLVVLLLLLPFTSGALAGGNLSLFNQTKKTIAEHPSSEKDTSKMKIKNHRRLKVDDLKNDKPAISDEEDEEEDPWDDGVDMGC